MVWGFWTPIAPAEDLVRPTDRMAASLVGGTTPIWVDRVWWNGDPCLEPSGVVLSAILGGTNGLDFQLDPDARLVLIECGRVELNDVEFAAEPGAWRVREFTNSAAANDWFQEMGVEPIQRGGAWDWASVIHPDIVRLEHAEWGR